MSAVLRLTWRASRAVLLLLAALVLAVEEWGWRPLTAAAARFARWGPLARVEQRIVAAPPGVALALFIVPALALFPVKLLALWFIHIGRTTLGIVVILAAKLVGTALVGRLFILTEPQLMRFAWFARALGWWRRTKQRVHETLGRWRPWRQARAGWRRWRTRAGRHIDGP